MQDINRTKVPAKLIPITEQDAVRMQWDLIKNWKPRSDVWPFTYGIGAVAGGSAISGCYFNSFYRKVLRIGKYGLHSTFLAAAALPTLCSVAMHATLVSSDILIGKTRCSVCIWTRATALQVAVGILYPLIMTPLMSFYLASTYYTYHVPKITHTTELMKLWWNISKPRFGHIYLMAALQCVLVSIITYQEMLSVQRIDFKLKCEDF